MSRIALVGAGPIGKAIADAAVEDGLATSVFAVVDTDAAAGDAAAHRYDATAFEQLDALPAAATGDVAVLTFSSDAFVVATAAEFVLGAGYHVVTTCEDLAWPPPEIRDRLESAARHAERVVVVTGANPGFVMDRFPLLAATASRRVTAVEVYRRVDTSVRRGPLVKKSGRGKSPVEFEAGVQSGAIGHRGLAASARLLAHGLGWPTHDIAESIEPVVADGTAIGLHQTASLETKDGRRILFDLIMAWEVDDPGDRVLVHGEPAVTFTIPGGYHGDVGTTAQGLVAIAHCRRLDPGFYLPTDLPLSVE